MKTSWMKIGTIGVDAGLCWIGDPCYCVTPDCNSHPAKTWDEFCKKIDFDAKTQQFDFPAGHPGLGVCVETGYGDGCYNVYARFEESPGWGTRVAEVKVVFIDDDK